MKGHEDMVKVKWTKAHVDAKIMMDMHIAAEVVMGNECAEIPCMAPAVTRIAVKSLSRNTGQKES